MMRLVPVQVPGVDAKGDRILDFDMDGGGRYASVLGIGAVRRLATERATLALSPEAAARVGTCRLLANGRVLVHPVADVTDEAMDSCAIVAPGCFDLAPIGVPHELFTAGDWIFATYSERTLVFTREPSFEADIVTAFDPAGRRLFGLADVLTRRRQEPDAYEVTSGCATVGGEFAFVASGSEFLWTLDAVHRAYHAVRPEVGFEDADDVEALAMDGANAVLLFAREDGLDLAWIDRQTGACSRRERLPTGELARYMDEPFVARPAGGWTLDAEARGLEGGQFILRMPDQVLLLGTDSMSR